MTTLFVIRHGLTAHTGKLLYGRMRGIELDGRGRAQAEALARRFEPIRLTAIYASPLERCVQTVEPLAAAQGLPIREREAWIEMDAGAWTGRSLGRLRRTRAWREVQGSPSTFRFPGGGEGFAEALARIAAELRWIARRHRRGRVAVATHGDIARLLLAYVQAMPLDRFQRIVVDPASVSVVRLAAPEPKVLLVNDTGDLGRFAREPAPPWEAAGRRGRVRG
ncbi:MAG: phosphoglycerate mutase [Actinomycetota bacterium]|nr:MAG: phosphoglycerate mutase [Actinomycetota bacterium]